MRLQPNEFFATGRAHRFVGRRALVRLLINADQLRDRIGRERLAIEQMLPSVNHHAELRAPIADVIIADHIVAEKRGDPRQCVAKHGAADVADVHRLRDIGRTEVEHDAFRLAR